MIYVLNLDRKARVGFVSMVDKPKPHHERNDWWGSTRDLSPPIVALMVGLDDFEFWGKK